MKKVLYILIIILLPLMQTFSQEKQDTIQFKSNGINYKCLLHEKEMTLNQLTALIKTNPTSLKYLNAAKLSNNISTVFLYTGSFLVGYGLGYSIARNYFYVDIISLGIGIIIVDIPILFSVKENLQKSINYYNSSIINKKSVSNDNKLNLGITQNGVGLVLRF